MSVKKKVLFVDDSRNVLSGIRRMMRSMNEQWEMAFVEDGHQALALMESGAFDVIISDLIMPVMSGTELLTEVKDRFPATVRIALSGQTGQEGIYKTVGPIHQYLSKPCDADTLRATVTNAIALRSMLESEKLKKAVSELESLPSLPDHYKELLHELESPDASIKLIEKIISRDMGMSAKLLQLVNSAFFGIGRSISNPAQAVILLGLEAVKNLVLMTHAFSQFNGVKVKGFSMDSLWHHSNRTAGMAKREADTAGADEALLEKSFIGGLLHDVGKLVLTSKFPVEYSRIIEMADERGIPHTEAEYEVLGASHSEIGAYLLGLWGLSHNIVEAAAFHHNPAKCSSRDFSCLTTVHVANALDHWDGKSDESGEIVGLDLEYLTEVGVADRVPEWQELQKKRLEEDGIL